MPNTFELIEAKTIVTPTTTLTFTTIPATYTDLKILFNVQTTGGGAAGTVMTLNGISTSNSSKYIIGEGANPGTGNLNYLYTGSTWGTNGTTGVFNFSEVYIPNAFSTQKKSYIVMNSAEKQDATSFMNVIVGLADQVTSAITSIQFTSADGGNFIANSTFYLYGIKSS